MALPMVEIEQPEQTQIVVDEFISITDINKDNCEALKNLYFFTESNPVFALDVEIVKTKKSNIEAAKEVGALIAKRAAAKNIKTVVYDRGGYIFHGVVKALAEAAREGGLEF